MAWMDIKLSCFNNATKNQQTVNKLIIKTNYVVYIPLTPLPKNAGPLAPEFKMNVTVLDIQNIFII